MNNFDLNTISVNDVVHTLRECERMNKKIFAVDLLNYTEENVPECGAVIFVRSDKNITKLSTHIIKKNIFVEEAMENNDCEGIGNIFEISEEEFYEEYPNEDLIEMCDGMFDHMLSFASELTGLSEDTLAGAMYPPQTHSRLDALRTYNDNEEALKRAAEEQTQNKINDLISQIQALKPRIDELIATGNACVQSHIPMTGQAFGCREDYDTNQFFTNSWSHLVGFVGNPNRQPCHIEYLGIDAGGACGSYNFRTDGVRVFSVHEGKPGDITAASIGHMQRFLDRFDEFESAFYAYVDRTIERQKKSVDQMISSAQEKVSAHNAATKRNEPENAR